MKLYLLRHGNALTAAEDPKKGLSEQGKKQINKIAKQAKVFDLKIDQIYYSTKYRAKMTAELFANVFGAIPLEEQQGLSPTDDPFRWMTRLTGEKNILLVSHLPFLEWLVEALLGKPLCFSFYEGSFLALNYDNEWRMELYLSNL